MIPEFEIVAFTKTEGIMTKVLALRPDGAMHADSSACALWRGTAERVPLADVGEMAGLIGGLQSNQALALGRLRSDLPVVVPVVTKRGLAAVPGAIARTAGFIGFAAGAPAVAPIDVDMKGMPPEVRQRIDAAGGIWPALCSVLPGLEGAARLSRASTSSAVWRMDTTPPQPMPGSSGQHYYVAVRDGADISRFLRAFADRCWLAGFGWMMTGAGGQILTRSLVDWTVGRPEHLLFEGPPVLMPPLAQDLAARAPVVAAGGLLDTATACPDSFVDERAQLREAQARERTRLRPEAEAARAGFIERRAGEIARHHGRGEISLADRRAALRLTEGKLLPGALLPFDDPALAGTTVAQVLADPALFAGETLADPIEGLEYGVCKAKVMLRGDGTPWIHSFAHGRTTYDLLHDSEAVRRALEQTDAAKVVAAFARLRLAADLDAAEHAGLRAAVAQRTGVGVREIDAATKEAQHTHDARLAEETRERAAASRRDQRPQVPLPPPDAPRLEVAQMLDRVMAAGPAPAMRDLDGWPVEIRHRAPTGMYLLGDPDAPAPAMPLISQHNRFTLQHEIERFVDFVMPADDGSSRAVALHGTLVEHFLHFRDSACPRVCSVAATPIVLPGGVLHAPEGLDQARRTFFAVDPAVRAAMPAAAECGREGAAAAALAFLVDGWLADVAADFGGKCVLIAMALTILQRTLLPMKPGFFVTAGQAQSGKTTAIGMVVAGATGREPPASAWATDENERRKMLIGLFMEGAPAVVLDNLPLGATISCPHIEAALTSPEFSDRLMGVNRRVTVPTSSVLIFNGNNVEPSGDLATRSLRCRIDVDHAHPENRAFAHPDPIGWTIANRGPILNALFTLLVANPHSRTTNGPGRFKRWWALCGAAVEYGAKCLGRGAISFDGMFQASAADSAEANATAGTLAALLSLNKEGKHDWFDAADVAAVLGIGAASEHPEVPETMRARLCDFLAPPGGRGMAVATSATIGKRLRSLVGRPLEITDEEALAAVAKIAVENGGVVGNNKAITARLVMARGGDGTKKAGNYRVEVLGKNPQDVLVNQQGGKGGKGGETTPTHAGESRFSGITGTGYRTGRNSPLCPLSPPRVHNATIPSDRGAPRP